VQEAPKPAPGPIRLEIEADKAEYVFRAPIRLTITYTNTSKEKVHLVANGTGSSDGFPGEIFTVTRAGERKTYHVQATDPAIKRVTIEPGKTWKRTVGLTELLSGSGVNINHIELGDAFRDPFGRPDDYSVRLTYRGGVKGQPASTFSGMVESNVVKLKVVMR
jgi:hypothetical protein